MTTSTKPENPLSTSPEFTDLEEILANPEKVLRIRLDRVVDPGPLERLIECTQLRSLTVSLSDVSRLLPQISRFSHLEELSLQACDVLSIPESILDLNQLRMLSLGNNSIREVPHEISNLCKLQGLNLSQNKIVAVPDALSSLANLSALGLSYNRLTMLPESIGSIANLVNLSLSVNQLQEIPFTIGELIRLRGLGLNSNRLTTLPSSICKLRELDSLSLENNPFKSLPACLSELATIKYFSIESDKRSLFMDWKFEHSTRPIQVREADLRFHVEPGSEQYQSLVRTIEAENLLSAKSEILSEARNAIEICVTTPDDYSTLGSSRLGGFPDLSERANFPQTDDLYWSFLGQINLADIASLNSYLPRQGLLSFFLDSTEGLNGKVHYFDGSIDSLSTIRHEGEDCMFDPQDDYTERPHRVEFHPYGSLPYLLEDLEAPLYEGYAESETLHESIDHHLNGHSFTQHESPQQQAADKLGGQSDEWIPLLQLGWDSDVGFCFWDAGTISFDIHRENLRRWDFSAVHVSLESS